MIIYDLVCDAEHRFEGWFKNIADFEQQMSSGLLLCPMCNSQHVRKVPTASYVNTGAPAPATVRQAVTPDTVPTQRQMLDHLRQVITEQFENVGHKFAEEAKRIHYGEVEDRNIYGTATADEVTELREEGITAIPVPIPLDKEKLN
ncbi:MAG: DUF1178 family protein [Gammaproteobacteria bacterium]|nr:DUF1178 family protein [Gammaproteobacteria bacterium]MDH5652736.1 DUF1178 family protein [Gammaproteobacteria bacterium]